MTPHDELRGAMYRKSSRSAQHGECVELALTDRACGLRDSKLADSPVLAVSADDGQAFLNAVKDGWFDR